MCRGLNRAVFLFLRFELFDERSDRRGDGGRKSVVLGLEALPNCHQPNAGAYAYAPERHHAVFLFGRLRRWTRNRGRNLTHLSRALQGLHDVTDVQVAIVAATGC